MRGQPWSKSNARLLKWAKRGTFVSLFGYACLMGGMLLATGCASKTPMVDTPSTFTPSTSDMGEYDDAIVAMCQGQALTVTYELVLMDPSAFTEAQVVEIVGYLYDNCIRDNGRGA